ncbi:tRNA threonylcarbamoyladenosine biosynthesis protein [Marivirga tractuosa]|uniref:Threonylcarbamoyl-AMP synthase n=1 Tax=Marivirga tractuosa (strain ATCC 23168 / DSM 4126 / NBRC 15989 / NCIMB 1408 / VKM B-1430 / H-43) TaxID=643867 RepID=E4TNA7_MARTH|nr:L-threonylcarbamoyladenylate synthase [Marivirga tractuosa]ADR23495.1 translation factor SUA5 [Marivirga tractuosa DSM 4126]BDD15826.1 tRNA threonylcarbamoyladenosine biosynthesis protein [Marivirga tractuosa]
MAEINSDINQAKELLDADQLIGLPTETVYGLAGNGLKANVVSKIFEVKNRPHFDPLILHSYSLNAISEYVKEIPETAKILAKAFWPGPLTILLERNEKIPDLTCSGLNRVAFRIPKHPNALSLLKILDYPLAAPSANPFGYISPTNSQHVQQQLGDKIPFILEGKISEVGIESTIVGFENGETVIYRLGGLDVDQIESLIGKVRILPHSSSKPDAPGMLKSHYAPSKNIILGNIEELIEQNSNLKLGVLSFSKYYKDVETSLMLSKSKDMHEAAKNLFSHLRKLDESNVDLIITEKVPSEGLGKAINDRLQRAAVKE